MGPQAPVAEVPALEGRVVRLMAAVQFVNILDFMIVMPMGPDLALGLGIPTSWTGVIGGAYTAAAAVGGLLASRFLDRYDRRTALAASLFGLFVGTAAGGLAIGIGSLLLARVVAGACGGPATSLALSIVADTVPVERRGRAMGIVGGAFALASVLGVPAGLELARVGGWRAPFFAVAVLGAGVAALAMKLLPSMRVHLEKPVPPPLGWAELRARPVLWATLAAAGWTTLAGFSLVPNLSAFLQYNCGYPRDALGRLYLVGGAISFFTMRAAGRAVDRYGGTRVTLAATTLWVLALAAKTAVPLGGLPPLVFFVAFMVANSSRHVTINAIASKAPRLEERAGFASLQSAVAHTTASLGAAGSSLILEEGPGRVLLGFPVLAVAACLAALLQPLQVARVERLLAGPAREG